MPEARRKAVHAGVGVRHAGVATPYLDLKNDRARTPRTVEVRAPRSVCRPDLWHILNGGARVDVRERVAGWGRCGRSGRGGRHRRGDGTGRALPGSPWGGTV